jgi:hypothetical protein
MDLDGFSRANDGAEWRWSGEGDGNGVGIICRHHGMGWDEGSQG